MRSSNPPHPNLECFGGFTTNATCPWRRCSQQVLQIQDDLVQQQAAGNVLQDTVEQIQRRKKQLVSGLECRPLQGRSGCVSDLWACNPPLKCRQPCMRTSTYCMHVSALHGGAGCQGSIGQLAGIAMRTHMDGFKVLFRPNWQMFRVILLLGVFVWREAKSEKAVAGLGGALSQECQKLVTFSDCFWPCIPFCGMRHAMQTTAGAYLRCSEGCWCRGEGSRPHTCLQICPQRLCLCCLKSLPLLEAWASGILSSCAGLQQHCLPA